MDTPAQNNETQPLCVASPYCCMPYLFWLPCASRHIWPLFERAARYPESRPYNELASLTRERESLERQIALLQDGSIERDMLDEQARLQLNYSSKRDLSILTGY